MSANPVARPQSRRAFIGALAVLPASAATASATAAPEPMSDLAAACLRTVERANWHDVSANVGRLSEADWDEWFRQQNEVWRRAIAEPSTGIRDIAAKAEMVRQDLDRFHPGAPDDEFKLLRLVLKEMAAMGGFA
ncbi:hypothetical protein [Enterovirga rhinocerotis]|uniref:Secreted protein n=1 Tax=Enterovirga rhinocerotis TaxID=1339210 RepID=A0A4R7BUR4_9HYPH|nr:hypothetical protein [Enterovirga rhinocerotis]TDR89544.1 hypothetical protein EV668_2374 [Enterovirga rhinocerotis]